MVTQLKTIKQLGFPETTWESILTYMWLDQFREQVLPNIHNSESRLLMMVMNKIQSLDNQKITDYNTLMIDYLVAPDYDWPPPPVTYWEDSRQAWKQYEKSIGQYSTRKGRNTFPLKRHYMHPDCYKV